MRKDDNMAKYSISTLLPVAYLKLLTNLFEKHGKPEVAQGQMKYMRYHFEFFGLKAPVWLPLTKKLFKEHGIYDGTELKTFVRLCLEEDHREVHYAAIEMVEKQVKQQDKDFIAFLEEMVVTKSWWDSVDWIVKLIGWHFLRFPELIEPIVWKWIKSDNKWLVRCAILFQLKYKKQTDHELLFALILEQADSKEFFIQKAAGWALREYSKRQPDRVSQFIRDHQLPKLTVREGLKQIKKMTS